jgi:hypothetical protein
MRARNVIVVMVALLTLSGRLGAQTPPTAWPSTIQLQEVHVESSAPGLLPPGSYTLDLQKVGGRLVGRLHQGTRDYDAIPFSIQGCDGVKSPNFAKRATVRALPPAGGAGRVELRIVAADARGCAITGAFKAKDDTLPSGRPNPVGPDQQAVAALSDLSIRGARPVPGRPEQLRVQVYNDGPTKSAPTQLKFFYHKNGAVTTAQAPIPAIVAKGSVWVVVGAGLPLKAADSVTVRADDPNVVNETDELNNAFKYK